MDEHKGKEEAENKFQESPEQPQPREQEAEKEDSSEESADQQQLQAQTEGYKEGRKAEAEEEEETETVVQLKEVVESVTEEEAAASPASVFLGILAHPCSLLQYLLRACARWCRDLHGDKPQQASAAVVPAPPAGLPEAVAPANPTEQGDAGGEKANYFYMHEVVTRVRAVRRGRPPGGPGHPREGRGGNGGIHN